MLKNTFNLPTFNKISSISSLWNGSIINSFVWMSIEEIITKFVSNQFNAISLLVFLLLTGVMEIIIQCEKISVLQIFVFLFNNFCSMPQNLCNENCSDNSNSGQDWLHSTVVIRMYLNSGVVDKLKPPRLSHTKDLNFTSRFLSVTEYKAQGRYDFHLMCVRAYRSSCSCQFGYTNEVTISIIR